MSELFYDYVIIGSGFGGSVSAMRLTEKGYSVLILEKGKRFEDEDFAKSNWQYWKYLWAPAIRAYGILQISILKGVMVLHGAGVGGGSLGYANVLEVPTEATFATPAWNQNIRWGEALRPHYETAKKMLGVARNPKLWKADRVLREMAEERGMGHTFRATEVGAFFGEAGTLVPDPYFGGEGPARAGCRHCGACMVGCRYNAKNTLPKNYLYFAEKNGAEILPEMEVVNVEPTTTAGARYAVTFHNSTKFFKRARTVYAKNVIFSAGVMGTMQLLLNLRDVKKSLPKLSAKLGTMARTNSEGLLGSLARKSDVNFSEGVAISSIYNHDKITRIEPVRYPDGSSLMRFLAAPLIDKNFSVPRRLLNFLGWALAHPLDFAKALFLPGWAHNVTILLVMQHADNRMRLKIGRSAFTLFRRGMVAEEEPGYAINAQVEGSHEATKDFARRTNGVALGSIGENLLNLPTTAHILGGAPVGKNADEGLIGANFEIHNYEGLYVIDGSAMPANPGVNPSLTITALAEYAMSQIETKRQ
ncbi:MAG: GMC family oxidoreductase N-terminal domain-containing protein [Anaerolineales bacterium]|nr:GMC family oxidoreductase N-terminal domain-containing protein [Anaerolineales bacterium]